MRTWTRKLEMQAPVGFHERNLVKCEAGELKVGEGINRTLSSPNNSFFSKTLCMPLPHDLCSSIQNAFRARLARVSVPHTTQNLGILSILLRHGFLTSLTRGTIVSPNPGAFPLVGSSQKRIWAQLKYREDLPVLSEMKLISKPSKRVYMDPGRIRLICSGRRAGVTKPIGMGEIVVVRTFDKENEWVEAREAVALKLGGEVICRAR